MALGAHAMRPKLRVAKQVAACHHTSSSDVQGLKKALKGGKSSVIAVSSPTRAMETCCAMGAAD